YTPYGKFVIFLDSGQVWRQIEGDADRADFSKGVAVTISRGGLGSYSLTIGDSEKLYKVRRVK
ncbi:MAG: hypothetical protein JO261_15540, partial [Alphaproteobacteria bacterium]|nr:hypothetical protein [Alphaproteobacteria bacterium]